ncbi:hypothetical protein TNIN_138201 [Trichonephila inaurata madagascariensis]|uniref:Neurotransmitter-gated ion-channel ligand-binding domain-containing protein n=1 Tax=Trichonephila inaurata madagascariensis TaxID=2747483 RepID=A0A8X6YEQ8_9ARAC|nr:hypothetical protein TNIN_138201 [Trichonephila inaurata madagascariensis]
MFFNDYPFDTQRCEFLIGILQTEERDISIGWLTVNDTYGLIVPKYFKPLQFFLKKPVAIQNKEATNSKSSLSFKFNISFMGLSSGGNCDSFRVREAINGKHHQRVPTLEPHCGRQLGVLLDQGGGCSRKSSPQRYVPFDPLHTSLYKLLIV